MTKRNPNVELFRVLLTLGIVLVHTVNLGGYRKVWLVDILMSCVVGFVFISGWFGVKFSWKKLIKLLLIGAYCALCAGLISGEGILVGLKWIKANWFFNSYVVMMVFAVFVNSYINQLPELNSRTILRYFSLLPFCMLVFVWGFGRTLPYLKDVFPKTDGLDAYGGITLLGIYCVARAVRVSGIISRIKTSHILCAIPVLLMATGIGLNDYNSPFAFLLAFCSFGIITRLRIPHWIGSTAFALAPSMYSVFLMHTNVFGFRVMEKLNHYFVESAHVNIYVVYFLTALIIFTSGLILDLPRRWLVYMWRTKVEKKFS